MIEKRVSCPRCGYGVAACEMELDRTGQWVEPLCVDCTDSLEFPEADEDYEVVVREQLRDWESSRGC